MSVSSYFIVHLLLIIISPSMFWVPLKSCPHIFLVEDNWPAVKAEDTDWLDMFSELIAYVGITFNSLGESGLATSVIDTTWFTISSPISYVQYALYPCQ